MRSFFANLAAVGLLIAGSAVAAEISVAECEALIVANQKFQVLKGKLDLLNTANQPTEILASRKVPSTKEKAAIALWVEEQRRCSKLGIDYYKNRSPEVGAIFDDAYADMFNSAADLYQGKITYGDFARSSVKRHQDVGERISGVISRFQEQQQRQQQQVEKERRESWERQQAENQQREALAQRQRQCELLKQQILIAANSGPTPYQVQQQRNTQASDYAERIARMTPQQQASAGMGQAGAQLGIALGQMLGLVNPDQEAAQQRQAALMEQVAIYRRECQRQ